MKPYLSEQTIVTLASVAGLCVLVFLSLSFSPAFATTLSRGTDVNNTLFAVRSMIYPLYAIKCWLPPFGACARGALDRIISLF